MLLVNRLGVLLQFLFVAGSIEALFVFEHLCEHARRTSYQLRVEVLQDAMDWEVVFVNKSFEALIPCIDITLYQDDLSVRVGINEVLGKADTGRIGHRAVIA